MLIKAKTLEGENEYGNSLYFVPHFPRKLKLL